MFFEYDAHAGFEFPTIHFILDAFIAGAGAGDGTGRNSIFPFARFQENIGHREIMGIFGNEIAPCGKDDV